MKALVTAFKPFNNQNINYSLETLKYIEGVDKLVVDVVYDECFKEIKDNVNLNNYDLIIALGEARSRYELTLEVRAKNISSCSLKDNKGIKKENEVINQFMPQYLDTKVQIDQLKDEISFSYDAGRFVCNNLYFHLLQNHSDKALFIHIPNCNDDENEYKKYAKMINNIIAKLND